MTKPNATEIAASLEPHVNTLLLATAAAQLERERVDKIQRRVLAEGNYYGRRPSCTGPSEQFRVTEPADAWHMDKQSAEAYHARLNAIHLAEGFAQAAEGHCPALTAERMQTEAEWALIAAAKEWFPGVTNNRLLCGTKTMGGLECRQKYLDLLVGLVVNSPGYTKPSLATV